MICEIFCRVEFFIVGLAYRKLDIFEQLEADIRDYDFLLENLLDRSRSRFRSKQNSLIAELKNFWPSMIGRSQNFPGLTSGVIEELTQ